MKIYRKIWENHFGPIPKDADGRSYEIHHIDGNHNNNDISNLKCVTTQEHYDIHYSQGDYFACWKMISQRMNKTDEEISQLISLSNKKRIENGTHNFLKEKNWLSNLSPEERSKEAKKRVNLQIQNRTLNFLGGEISKKTQIKRIENGTHHFLNKEAQKNRSMIGSQKEYICPHCNKKGKGGGMIRFHMDNCKELKNG